MEAVREVCRLKWTGYGIFQHLFIAFILKVNLNTYRAMALWREVSNKLE